MSSSVKMSFSALPNIPFIQGFPGILGADPYRKPPAVHGVLELRLTAREAKARYLAVEFVRIETLPGTNQSTQITIGQPIRVWMAPEGKEWDYIHPSDFRFYIPLPLNIPGSIELKPKGGGIRYELVASFHHKSKGGLLRKESDPTTVARQPIYLMKHELHCAWPIYNVPEARNLVQDELELVVHRPGNAWGVGDRIEVQATLTSSRPKPLKLRAFELALVEIVKIRPPAAGNAKQSSFSRQRIVDSVEFRLNDIIARTDEKRKILSMNINPNKINYTCRGGTTVEVMYELSVKAIMEGCGDLVIEHLPAIIGVYGRQRARDLINQIGYVDALSRRPGTSRSPSVASSHPGFQTPSQSPYPTQNPSFSPQLHPAQAAFPRSPQMASFPRAQSPLPPAMVPQQQQPPAPAGMPIQAHPAPAPRLPPSPAPLPAQPVQPFAQYPFPNPGPRDPYRASFAGPPTEYQQQAQMQPRQIQPFAARPVSSDSSSLYSFNQSQTDVSSIRDIRTDAGHPANRLHRPTSHLAGAPQFGMTELSSEARRTSAAQDNLRPNGPQRSSMMPAISSQSRPPSIHLQEEARSASPAPSKSARPLGPSPRASFVHTDAGPVKLTPNGDIISLHSTAASNVSAPGSPEAGVTGRRISYEADQESIYRDAIDRRSMQSMGRANSSIDTDVPQDDPPSYSPPDAKDPVGHASILAAVEEKMRPKSSPQVEKLKENVEPRTSENRASVMSMGWTPSNEGARAENRGEGSASHYNRLSLPVSGPMSEKEQIRRYYEAQARVAQSQTGGPIETSAESRNDNTPSIPRSFTAPSFGEEPDELEEPPAFASGSSTNARDAFPSAEQEKDIMRRRFEEAQKAVSSRSVASPSTHVSAVDTALDVSNVTAGSSSDHAAGSSRSHDAHSQSGSNGFLSAEQEKEAMRQRYEEAVKAMEEARLGGYPSETVTSRESSYKRTETPVLREGKGKAVAITNPEDEFLPDPAANAPSAPTLPPRPPGEYKELLSPQVPTVDLQTSLGGPMPAIAPAFFGGPMLAGPAMYPSDPLLRGRAYGQPQGP